jgi:hypothetical protein
MLIKKTPDLDGMNADTVDGMHAGDLLKKDDDTMAGKLGLSANSTTGDSITASNGAASKAHIGTTGDENGALSINTNIAVVGTVDLIDNPALPSWRTVLDSDADSFGVERAPAGTATWADRLIMDSLGHVSSDVGPFGTRSATMVVASSTASTAAKEAADYVCDGTGDQTEINAALAAIAATGNMGTVQLSEGTFYLSAVIQMPGNTVLKGQGMNVTIVTKKDGAGNFSLITNASGANNITIKDLTLDGNRNGNAADSRAIQFTSISRPLVDGVEVRQTTNDCMGFTGCSQVIVNNCYVHDGSVSGIDTLATSNYVVVKNCRIHNIAGHGVYIHGTNYASLTGNVINGCGQVGISVPSNSSYVSMTGNVIKNCVTNGVQLDSPYSTSSGNIATNCGTHSILNQNGANTISGNIVAYGGGNGYGICSYNASAINGVNATGNLIYSCANDGIVFQNSNNSAVTGNNIIKSAMHGLYSGEASNHTLIAGNLLSENGTAADNTYYGMCINSGTTDNLVVGNKVYRGASGNRALYDLYVIAGTSNNTVLMNEFTPATGGATYPWISGWTYRKTHTITSSATAGWWVRWWTDSTPNTVGDGTLVEDSNWNTVNVTNYRSSGTNINARAECTFVAPYAQAFTFYCSSDDGIRMWFDGAQVINGWVDQGDTTYSWTSGTLTLNSEHTIVVEHYQGGGGEHFHVEVQSASLARQDLSGTHCYSPHHTSSLSNYQMRFKVTATGADSGDTVSCAGHSANSLWDVRFTNSTGTVLPQWVESNDGSTAIIWVKVDSIPVPGSITLYMFYGNAGAGNVSTTSIFEWFDHFDDGDYAGEGWQNQSGANAWITEGGTELYTGGAYSASIARSTVSYGVNYACVFREYISPASGEAYTGWNGSNGHNAMAYWVWNGALLGRTNNGSDSNTGNVAASTDKGNWHVYEVRRRNYSGGSPHVDFLFEGTVTQSTTTNVDTSTAMNLYFMGASNISTVAHLDWIFVRKSAPVEPTHSTWSAEATGTFYVNNSGTNTVMGFDNSANLNRTS